MHYIVIALLLFAVPLSIGQLNSIDFFASLLVEAQQTFDLVVDTATCGQCWQRSFVARRAAIWVMAHHVLEKVDVSLAAPQIPESQLIVDAINYDDLSKLLGITAAQLGFHLHKDRKFFKYANF